VGALLVLVPVPNAPAEVIVFNVKSPGEAVELSVIAPEVVVVIEPALIVTVLAVMATALLAPVINPAAIVRVLVTLIVLPAPTFSVPPEAPILILLLIDRLFCSVQTPVPSEELTVKL